MARISLLFSAPADTKAVGQVYEAVPEFLAGLEAIVGVKADNLLVTEGAKQDWLTAIYGPLSVRVGYRSNPGGKFVMSAASKIAASFSDRKVSAINKGEQAKNL